MKQTLEFFSKRLLFLAVLISAITQVGTSGEVFACPTLPEKYYCDVQDTSQNPLGSGYIEINEEYSNGHKEFGIISNKVEPEIDLGLIKVVADNDLHTLPDGTEYKTTCYWRYSNDQIQRYLQINYYQDERVVKQIKFFESRQGIHIYRYLPNEKITYDCRTKF